MQKFFKTAASTTSTLLLISTAVVAVSTSAQADNSSADTGYGAGIHIGSLGVGVDGSYRVNPNFDARLGLNSFTYSRDQRQDGINYNVHAHLKSIALLGDFYANGGNGFHFTGGLVDNESNFDGTAQPDSNNSILINGKPYTSAEAGVVAGNVRFPRVEPYVGIGFGRPSSGASGLSFTADFGAILASKPSYTLTATGSVPGLATDVAAQQATTQQSLNRLTVYPVIQFGIGYHF